MRVFEEIRARQDATVSTSGLLVNPQPDALQGPTLAPPRALQGGLKSDARHPRAEAGPEGRGRVGPSPD